MEDLSVVQLRVLGSQEHEAGCDLAGLSNAAETGLLAVSLHLIGRAGSGLKRRVNGSRGNGVDSDTPGHELLGESAGERGDGSLGGSVVHEASSSAECDGRGGVDDAGGC